VTRPETTTRYESTTARKGDASGFDALASGLVARVDPERMTAGLARHDHPASDGGFRRKAAAHEIAQLEHTAVGERVVREQAFLAANDEPVREQQLKVFRQVRLSEGRRLDEL